MTNNADTPNMLKNKVFFNTKSKNVKSDDIKSNSQHDRIKFTWVCSKCGEKNENETGEDAVCPKCGNKITFSPKVKMFMGLFQKLYETKKDEQ